MPLKNLKPRPVLTTVSAVAAVPFAAFAYSHVFPTTTTRQIHIAAPPEKVWEVLTGFSSFTEWNPHITHAEGQPEVGTRLAITVTESGRDTRFTPEVLVADPARELRWRGNFLIPGLADGTHSFTLTPDRGGTLVTQSEFFTGALGPLTPFLFDLGASFDASNQALRDRVEGR